MRSVAPAAAISPLCSGWALTFGSMSVTIETPGGHSMTVEDRRWSSEARPDLAEVFNAELEAGNLPVMPGDPDPDGNEALRVLEELGGGRIVTRTPVPAAQDGAVY